MSLPCTAPGKTTTDNLRCEYLENPLGIDESVPRLSWTIKSDRRSEMQSAYQILVASSPSKLAADIGDLWDTGRLTSDQTTHIAYVGRPLASRQPVWWKVRSWDRDGLPSPWSEPATWEMGQLAPEDWQAEWIGRNTLAETQPLPLLRRELSIPGEIKQARTYICGHGYYELRINGHRVGDHRLDPGYTRYDRRLLYTTYDVTSELRSGQNAIGVMLGNGWYNVQTAAAWDFDSAPWRAAPRLLFELHVEMKDGSRRVIASDENWRTADGPIVSSSIYGGETYDARREQIGWDRAGFDERAWRSAELVDAPGGKLSAQAMYPTKTTHQITPVGVTEPTPGVHVFDAGQNLAGNAEIRVHGPAGTKVALNYGELLDKQGRVSQANIGVHVWKKGKDQPFQTDTYILKGDGEETWQSRFVYHGFQYVEVTGATQPLTVDDLRIGVMHSAVPQVGSFACSNSLLNQIANNANWSFLSNLHGIPTDCPHREKNGWTGDAHLACEMGLCNFDAVTVYEKWIDDLADEQQPGGKLPGIVPTSGWGYHWGHGPGWDSAFLLIPQYLHLYYGDPRVRERQFERHVRYVDYLTSRAEDGIVRIGLGDWSPAKTKTPEALTSTVYYYHDALFVAETAEMLGHVDEAHHYRELAERIRTAIQREFYDSQTGIYANGSQTAQSCALYQGITAPGQEALVLSRLVENVESSDSHIDTGVLGAKYLLHALSDRDQAELAYRVATQKTQPGWGWWIEQGATTLWEGWGSGASHNHIFFGDIVNWMYRVLAGINPDPASPGFKHVVIRPRPVGDLTWVKAHYDSIRGRIESHWTRDHDKFHLTLEVPANSTATVYLPTSDVTSIRESGRPIAEFDDIALTDIEHGNVVLQIGSGHYDFSCQFFGGSSDRESK